jgi:Family of unknown function (DUF6247)
LFSRRLRERAAFERQYRESMAAAAETLVTGVEELLRAASIGELSQRDGREKAAGHSWRGLCGSGANRTRRLSDLRGARGRYGAIAPKTVPRSVPASSVMHEST